MRWTILTFDLFSQGYHNVLEFQDALAGHVLEFKNVPEWIWNVPEFENVLEKNIQNVLK